jgi:DNA-binding NarL/FixJ family response regulator
MPTRVAVFDDAPIFLEQTSAAIAAHPEFALTGAFPDCLNLSEKMKSSRPEVVIMDIEMPGVDGIEGLRLIKRDFPAVYVIMQTSHDEDNLIFHAVCAGASGYLLKGGKSDEILASIESVLEGGAPMSPTVAKRVLHLLQNGLPPELIAKPDYQLSAREKEVLACLVQGMSFKMIADACHISYETVRSHMKHIYSKLHVVSNTEAVAKALREGLV